jgi:hypothetical protein
LRCFFSVVAISVACFRRQGRWRCRRWRWPHRPLLRSSRPCAVSPAPLASYAGVAPTPVASCAAVAPAPLTSSAVVAPHAPLSFPARLALSAAVIPALVASSASAPLPPAPQFVCCLRLVLCCFRQFCGYRRPARLSAAYTEVGVLLSLRRSLSSPNLSFLSPW